MIDQIMGSDEFQKPEFKVAGRDFKVTKLPPLHGYKLFMDHVRPCFVAMQGVDMEKPEAMFEVFAAIDSVHLNELSKEFLRHCIYTRNDAGQMVKMTTDLEGLTQELDPGHIMFIMIRAFARNFGGFYSAFAMEAVAAARGMGIELPQDQQTHSSTQESVLDSTPSKTSKRSTQKRATRS